MVIESPIEVVLPTYNGSAFIEDQIASIYEQTIRPFRLLVRDDGSIDHTREVLLYLQQHYGSWLQILPADTHLGCAFNVNSLLEATTAPYVALADQDDIWLPCKLERSYWAIRKQEMKCGISKPLLVHSDLQLVNVTAKSLGCTYLQRQRLDPSRTRIRDLALTNVVTGCTVLMNRSLLNQALPIPQEAVMHDWWIALVASLLGEICYLPEATVLYRQHGHNVVGASGLGLGYWLKRVLALVADPAAGGHTRAALSQLKILERRYGREISRLTELLDQPRHSRWLNLLSMSPDARPWKHGLLRTIGLYALLVFMPRS